MLYMDYMWLILLSGEQGLGIRRENVVRKPAGVLLRWVAVLTTRYLPFTAFG